MVIGLPGKFLSPVLKESVNAVPPFLAMGDSAGCLPIFMPFLFPLCYKDPGFAVAGRGLHPQSQGGGSSLPRAPWGLGKGLRSSLWRMSAGGPSQEGGVSFLFFFFLISPLSCLLGIAKSECNAQNYSNHLRKYKLGKGPTAGESVGSAGGGTITAKILSPS